MQVAKKSGKVLGRGLAALMPDAPPQVTSVTPGLRHLPIEKIHPNKDQPRKVFDEAALEELANSIRIYGILQPIVVRRNGDQYEIVAGERRWRAAGRAGLHEIPAVVKEFSNLEVLEVALIENLQRQDLDPIEEAQGYQRLLSEHQLTHDQIATAVSKSRVAVTNALRLLKLPADILVHLAHGKLTAGHARAVMSLADPQQMRKLAQAIVERGLSVRDAEQLAKRMQESGTEKSKNKNQKRSAEESDVENRLQQSLGAEVKLHQSKGKGTIEIFFNSFAELDGLLEKLSA
jgi:ParB family transcriptional regulator, chromosome partitioning protein